MFRTNAPARIVFEFLKIISNPALFPRDNLARAVAVCRIAMALGSRFRPPAIKTLHYAQYLGKSRASLEARRRRLRTQTTAPQDSAFRAVADRLI